MAEEVIAVFIPIIMTLVIGAVLISILLFKIQRKTNAD